MTLETTHTDARFWDRTARKYAARPVPDPVAYERTLACTRERLTPTDAVLELGCGTGTTALRLAPHVGRVLATDVSPEMITLARDRAADALQTNLAFAVATPETVPPTQGPFDTVLAFNLLHLLKDRRAALRRVHALTKTDGLFISKTPCLSEMSLFVRFVVSVLRLVGKAPYVSFFDTATLEREIETAGFTIVERARHGSTRKDARIFLVARKSGCLSGSRPQT